MNTPVTKSPRPPPGDKPPKELAGLLSDPSAHILSRGPKSGQAAKFRALELSLRERELEILEAHRIARIGTWRWILASDTVTWSDEVFHAFDLDPAEPAPNNAERLSMFTPESQDRIQAAVQRITTRGDPYELDVEFVSRTGKPRWIILRGEVAVRSGGVVTQLRGTVQEITERKHAEEAVARSELRYRTVLESITDGLAVTDRNWIYTYFSEQGGRILNLRPQDLIGRCLWDVFPHALTTKFGPTYLEAFASGQPAHFEEFYPDPLNKWIECHCYPSPEGLSVYFRDVTERKLTDAALRDREQRFTTLAETLPQLIWASAPDGARIYANSRCAQFTGLSESRLLSDDWTQHLHPADAPRVQQRWRHSLLTGEPFHDEHRLRRHDGVYRSFLASAIPVRDDTGSIQRWIGSATDIHDQKLAEEALRRTEKLAATGRLAASIAHEINNPLEAVTNALYLALMDTSLNDNTRGFLTMADHELARVAHVTTQNLRFHLQSESPAEADLAELMDSTLSLFNSRFRAFAVKVRREYRPGQILTCRADEVLQVFANLLSNTLDATRKGGRVRIRIRLARDWTPGVQSPFPGLRVTVADTGHGIPAELQPFIFEPFISTRETTGTGLGLWVSEGIVHKHKGRITLRSRTKSPHRGTVFSLFFPFNGFQTGAQPA
jgi:PAS domain S-box-containing protein